MADCTPHRREIESQHAVVTSRVDGADDFLRRNEYIIERIGRGHLRELLESNDVAVEAIVAELARVSLLMHSERKLGQQLRGLDDGLVALDVSPDDPRAA